MQSWAALWEFAAVCQLENTICIGVSRLLRFSLVLHAIHWRNICRGMAKRKRNGDDKSSLWLWGRHAVLAALANPRRRIHALLATPETAGLVETRGPRPEIVPRVELAKSLPTGAVHQGLAARVAPLPGAALSLLAPGSAAEATGGPARLVVVLDRVTDPRNVGATLRAAAAFGAVAMVTTDAHAPSETGILAKAASGALEAVPIIRVTNLARALATLAGYGYWRIGLDADAPQDLDAAQGFSRVALVLGAEGRGLRRLTRERCDLLVRIPIGPAVESLNVAAAGAIALYALARANTLSPSDDVGLSPAKP